MSASVQFTPLCGEEARESCCYLLEIDECKILLDCGWDWTTNGASPAEALAQIAADIDCVLITHADLEHIGMIPQATARLGLSCPIYATLPVFRIGKLVLYEAIASFSSRAQLNLTYDDVDNAWDKIVPLRYSQEIALSGRGEGIVITPYLAGHSLGGAIWKIAKENEEIAYAMEFNHRKEGHLDGTVIESAFNKPSLLITDAYYSSSASYVPRKERDSQLVDRVLETIKNKGSVLMPVEFAGRTLELFLIMHKLWELKKLHNSFQLVFLSHNGYHLIEYAKAFIEWMSASCRNAIDSSRENPFSLKHLYLCYSIEELEDIMEQKPVVVFATSKHINNSFAEDVFVKFASNEKNLILFTNKSLDPGTLGSQVLKLYSSSGGKVSFTKKSKIPLEGLELKNYLEQKRLEANSLQKEDISYSESESEEETQEAEEEKGAAQIFKKRARLASSYPMFVSKESHIITDDYGEVLKVEEFFINSGQQQKMLEDLDSKMSGTDDESDEDMTEPELPTKDIEELVTIDVLCSVHFIAFEGRLDGTSIRNILQNLSPRKMIIVKGDSESKRILQSFAEANVCKHVSVPKNNSTLSITSESAFKLKIRDSLDKHLRFSRIRDSYEIAWLDGVLEWESGFGIPTLRKTEDNEYEGHTSVFLGDVKLSDVQQKLITEANIEAEFVSGILVCGEEGTLNIRRKPNENVIQIRGGLSEDYFSVRNSIYNQYHIV